MNDYLINLVVNTPNDVDLGRKVREYFNQMKTQAFYGKGYMSTTSENQQNPDTRNLLKG
jgi:hypothetical protein